MPPGPTDPLERLTAGEWRLRPFFRTSDPEKLAEQRAAEEYLEERWRRTYRFAEPWSAEVKDKVDALYRNTVKPLKGGMGCMQAAYQCLETIHPDRPNYEDKGRESLRERVFDVSKGEKKFNSVDLMMEVLQRDGLAGEPVEISFDGKTGVFSPPPETEVLKMFDFKEEGVYFFGVSVSAGNHTVLLAVDNTPQADGKPQPRIYWLDQNTRGLTNDVTGKLAEELKEHSKTSSRIWALRPEQVSRQ